MISQHNKPIKSKGEIWTWAFRPNPIEIGPLGPPALILSLNLLRLILFALWAWSLCNIVEIHGFKFECQNLLLFISLGLIFAWNFFGALFLRFSTPAHPILSSRNLYFSLLLADSRNMNIGPQWPNRKMQVEEIGAQEGSDRFLRKIK